MGLSGYRERQGQKMATGIHGMIEKRLHYLAVPLRIHGAATLMSEVSIGGINFQEMGPDRLVCLG